jgi:hypothetical protein
VGIGLDKGVGQSVGQGEGEGEGADVGEGKGKDTDRGLSLIRINFDLLFSSENLLNHTLTKLLRCFFALVVLQSGSLYLYSYREYTH